MPIARVNDNGYVPVLLKYWPKQNSTKEVLFISELADLIDTMTPEVFGEVST
jgi:SpoU rRNA methylase family enzyme